MKAKKSKTQPIGGIDAGEDLQMVVAAIGSVEGYFKFYISLKQKHPLENDQRLWEYIEGELAKYNTQRYNQFTSFSSAKNRFIKTNRHALKNMFL